MDLFKKKLFLDKCPILYHCNFTKEILEKDFEIRGGEWYVENNWLIGENRGNFPGMVISRASYNQNVMLDFIASTVEPCTRDINVMWNGSWVYETNTRGVAYVVGLAGWGGDRVGFEKSPEYKLNGLSRLFHFEPGRNYHIQVGSINGHVFVIVDGELLMEVTDPDPIDFTKHGKIGFEAYCTKIRFSDFYIKGIVYEETGFHYEPEF